MRAAVMGEPFVELAMRSANGFTLPLQEFINDHAWGSVWLREGISLKLRSLVTIAVLTALKSPKELSGHVRGALNNGCTPEEIQEVILHCAVYAGVPASAEGFRVARAVIEEDIPGPVQS
ncbi:hypothetical protein BR1R5_35580 [Pseudomonas sp. BR1R-5]|nr:hypothetical protein BR1R5_35580 [Pseudomonas sp. BR1R-5]